MVNKAKRTMARRIVSAIDAWLYRVGQRANERILRRMLVDISNGR
jgi:hypothetical protein